MQHYAASCRLRCKLAPDRRRARKPWQSGDCSGAADGNYKVNITDYNCASILGAWEGARRGTCSEGASCEAIYSNHCT